MKPRILLFVFMCLAAEAKKLAPWLECMACHSVEAKHHATMLQSAQKKVAAGFELIARKAATA